MKKIFKFALIAIAFSTAFVTTELRAQDNGMGITVGLEYMSNYLSKGQYVFAGNQGNGGAFFPYVNYNMPGTGLNVGIMGEISEAWIGGAKEDAEHVKKTEPLHAIDFNIGYTYTMENITTITANVWYYRYQTNSEKGYNESYFDGIVSASADAIPLNPMLAFTYSYFMDKDYYEGGVDGKNESYYVQLGIGHSFNLVESATLDLGAVAGWRHNKVGGSTPDDISDINLSAGTTITKGMLTFTGSFHYVIVPGTQYKYEDVAGSNVKDINRFYATFGVACSI